MKISISYISQYLRCVCVFIPSPVRVDTLLMKVPGTPIRAYFFEFELKPTGTQPNMNFSTTKYRQGGIHL